MVIGKIHQMLGVRKRGHKKKNMSEKILKDYFKGNICSLGFSILRVISVETTSIDYLI